MKLIVGLGNPGSEYQNTRHNAGFMAIDRLAKKLGLDSPREKFHAIVLEGSIGDDRIMLMKPQTYMNKSGLAVGEAAAFYKVRPDHVMVAVDDTALPLGALRIRANGSAGSHNGLADIQRAIGTSIYPRLRIGIGAPQIGEHKVPQKDYVLGTFTAADMGVLNPALDEAVKALDCWIAGGIDKTMNRFNKSPETKPTDRQN
jgi:PTH1 family peptidyl-tRNA hydrolase